MTEQPVRKVDSGRTPLPRERSETRDSAEILEGAPEFSTTITRDEAEIRDHKLHEGVTPEEGADGLQEESVGEEGSTGEGGVGSDGTAGEGGVGTDGSAGEDGSAGADGNAGEAGNVEDAPCPTPCEILEQNRSGPEVEPVAHAAIDDEDVTKTEPVPEAKDVATPGDVCKEFYGERPPSPYADYNIKKAMSKRKKGQRPELMQCKGKYTSQHIYKSLQGSLTAIKIRKKRELEMQKRRKYYERLHERNKWRREKERCRAKEKRRMLRCRDQSKIPENVGNISINKAFYFRFNYNQQLPFLPSSMDQHMNRFKRPPFRRYHKGSHPCHKLVDEFEKLRVLDAKTGLRVASRPSGKAKA